MQVHLTVKGEHFVVFYCCTGYFQCRCIFSKHLNFAGVLRCGEAQWFANKTEYAPDLRHLCRPSWTILRRSRSEKSLYDLLWGRKASFFCRVMTQLLSAPPMSLRAHCAGRGDKFHWHFTEIAQFIFVRVFVAFRGFSTWSWNYCEFWKTSHTALITRGFIDSTRPFFFFFK